MDTLTKHREPFIAFMTEVMTECLRATKPGGHALVWALPRTSHWTATALEDAGWEIRDCLVHCFGSGFPKSLDISKAIDKQAGAEREVVGEKRGPNGQLYSSMQHAGSKKHQEGWQRPWMDNPEKQVSINMETAPATPEAQRWQGWGSALKPSHEMWILARKPLAAANLASNVLQWGTGAIHIDACRVGAQPVQEVIDWCECDDCEAH